MYLKSIEMIGFKSFADRTKLEFSPGMTAIVGPNGCGKSNVSDAIRWVLGEQSARALRGHKMEDCIFTGTDTRKPVGMAEVSITFTDCEGTLETEYNEVTVTRRVFRSGEGQYFINKVPCRLKDIHRLFLGTGIGTDSYSLMEQGRIDLILSSRPEDRREVFEEASGITKFKADKKEALRKLEQTEQNLLRLADVVREVKRQIGSLQRQAGKARRFKELRDELKTFDVYLSRDRLAGMAAELKAQETQAQALGERLHALQAEIDRADQHEHAMRAEISATEQRIEEKMTELGEVRAQLEQGRALLKTNDERIAELRALSERDVVDIRRAHEQIAALGAARTTLATETEQAERDRHAAEAELTVKAAKLAEVEKDVEGARRRAQELRNEAVELETRASKVQNSLMQLEARDHANVLRRERLTTEHAQLARVAEDYGARQQALEAELAALREKAVHHKAVIDRLAGSKAELAQRGETLRSEAASLRTETASKTAKIELLAQREAAAEDFPGGARLVLGDSNPLGLDRDSVIGALAGLLEIEPAYRTAVQAVLRTWLDAIVVRDAGAALTILARLQDRREGSIRLLSAGGSPAPAAGALPFPGERLASHVSCAPDLRPLMERLLGHVVVVDTLSRSTAAPPEGWASVTRDGVVVTPSSGFEFWMPEESAANPMARKIMISDLQKEVEAIARETAVRDEALRALTSEGTSIEESTRQAQAELEEARTLLSQKQGEVQFIAHEAAQARDRMETVAWELDELKKQTDSGAADRQVLAEQLAAITDRRAQARSEADLVSKQAQELERARSELYEVVSEHKVRFSEARQRCEHLKSQRGPIDSRIEELEALVKGREAGLTSHETTIEKLAAERGRTAERLPALEAAVDEGSSLLQTLRQGKAEQTDSLRQMEGVITGKRASLDEVRETKAALDVKHAELRLHRQNLVERVTGEYAMLIEDVLRFPEPSWEGERPTRDVIETRVAELRAKIEAMGPVNLVAIEEYQELEERHAFLTKQMEDLVTSKQQLMDMIRKINATTSEMFAETFARINENFEKTFHELFNGGTAKLVLVNEEDVLECGIEIIARPPGKRLQSVSLLSGGERTLTAVALLFAIYMIRPSPFCVLDELDAALDESNIERFVRMLKSFLTQSQFVVITHNRRTISAASVLYGVTMAERGVSRIVSMKFADYEKAGGGAVLTAKPPAGD